MSVGASGQLRRSTAPRRSAAVVVESSQEEVVLLEALAGEVQVAVLGASR